jgi:ubiquinone/menaquinone biosynthesis C-methylase UbiE
MNELTKQEREKYTQAWQSKKEGQSKTAVYLIKYLSNVLNKKHKILELGSGNGIVVKSLRDKEYDIYGVDITSAGFAHSNYLIEACLWELPFKDNEFDVTFSTDVLEHIPPEKIEDTIKEIYRVTKRKTLHCITTWKDNRGGFVFHLTIQPIDWWFNQFESLNEKKIETQLFGRTSVKQDLSTLFK